MIIALLLVAVLAVGRPVPVDVVNARLGSSVDNLPNCLSRFNDYPPGSGKLGFPRCLFEDPLPSNQRFWLKGIDFSCVSPWNDSHGALRAGTAISKRHIIFAKHFPLDPGTRIAFVGKEGDVSHYSVKVTKALGSCDIMIGLLDYELTPDVRPAKVLPVNFEKWITVGSKWPVVTFNQFEQAVLSTLYGIANPVSGKCVIYNRKNASDRWQLFAKEIVGGDSGNPAFLLYGEHPILIYCLFSGGVGQGHMIHEHRQEVQQAMDELCPGYALEAFDFTM